ncbi:MAG: thiamine diphosphokinase [Bacteriovoracaceae bacterium]|nr:thiamine diphosphokinase [Bacteroidota bacterium]
MVTQQTAGSVLRSGKGKRLMNTPKQKHALVICNGEMPSLKLIAPLLKTKPFIICADGGANKARPFGITPHVIIGDLDSITQKTRHYFSSVPIVHNPNQYNTDLEKALDHLLENGITSATVIGATGDRPDHTISNFSILLKYHRKLTLRFFDERCTVEVVRKSIRFRTVLGQQISLVPMGKSSGITTSGLKYPLKKESLELGVREGLSNEATGSSVSVNVLRGALLLFIIHPHITH